MELLKRPRTNMNDEYDDSRRKKISVITAKCITTFEDLSNELMYEIFEFLDFHHTFQGFYDINERFQNLFIYSNLPIRINISSISKSTFHRYLKDIIISHTDRIQSLRLSNPFAVDMSLLLLPVMRNLTRLESLVINNTESKYIDCVVDHLSTLPLLSSLTLASTDGKRVSIDIYQKIFLLPALKYCQLSIETEPVFLSLSAAPKGFSPIEHLIINNEVSFSQLDHLLSYVPQLRRLSLGHLNGHRSRRTRISSATLNYLTHVSLDLYSISFNDFELLITDFFRQVQVLRITSCYMQYPIPDMEYVNADRWQQCISTHLPDLRIFDFQQKHRTWFGDINQQGYENEITKFSSLFWIEHQWFFEYQYYKTKYHKNIIFYSTNPFRRKTYLLAEGPIDINLQTNVDFVQHVCIHNINRMKEFGNHFPNATELTLAEKFHVPRDSMVTDLNRIIPLRQLTKLTLQCVRFSFEQLIELLHFTPNIHILTFDAVLLYRMDAISLQQNTLFQLLSNTNTVTNVTIDKEITLEKIQLLVALFPRLEYLTMNMYVEALEPIARFLLSKPNDNTRYLSSLCISKKRREFMIFLRRLIESEQLLHDYTLKAIDRKLYLWW